LGKEANIKDWWIRIALGQGNSRKAMAYFLMLVSWEIWKERNARVEHPSCHSGTLNHHEDQNEARIWSIADAKCLSNGILGD
jgi:hypothetical protein